MKDKNVKRTFWVAFFLILAGFAALFIFYFHLSLLETLCLVVFIGAFIINMVSE